MPFAYLDSSAFLKLVLAEAESEALLSWLAAWPQRASSRLLWLEALRTVRRYRPDRVGAGRLLLSGLDFIEISDDVLESAASLQPLTLRSLDAIHLASAQMLMEALGVLVTYDRRMVEAAHQLGLSVASPT